jgi:copper chaperone CopZ
VTAKEVTVPIAGMTCAACSARIEKQVGNWMVFAGHG